MNAILSRVPLPANDQISPARPRVRPGIAMHVFGRSLSGACLLSSGLAILPLDPGHAKSVIRIPNPLACLLGYFVFGLRLPGGNRLLALPVGNGDAEPIRGSRALDAKEARLLCGQLHHALSHLTIPTVAFRAQRGENDSV